MSGELLQSALELEKSDTDNAAAMERLITDLLDAERMAAGKISMDKSNESVDGLFDECNDIFAQSLNAESAKLRRGSKIFLIWISKNEL